VAKSESKLIEFFLPTTSDWELRAASAVVAKAYISTFIFVLVQLPLNFFVQIRYIGWIGVWSMVMSAVCLLLLRLGFPTLSRVIYFTSSCATSVVVTGMTLGRSFNWIFTLNSLGGVAEVTAPKEKGLRLFVYIACFLALVLSLFVCFDPVFPWDYRHEYENWLMPYAIFNVSFSLILRLFSSQRFHKEMMMYKGRLEQQTASSLQQAKMTTLGEMAGGVAHEINNPLAMILGNATQVFREVPPGAVMTDKMSGKIDKVIQTVDRIAKIVNSLRVFSRNADEDPFQKSKIENILEDTKNFFGEKLKSHQVELKISGDLNIEFDCRSSQISQVLVNLINNSTEAVASRVEKWVEIHVQTRDGKKVVLTVTDSGNGIPEAIADKLMQPFFTTKEVGKGTGLGLSVSKGIIESHRGTIELDRSCPNTRFVIELPIHQALAANQKPSGSAVA